LEGLQMARRSPPNRRDTAAWTNALRREAFATIANGPDRGHRKLELIARAVVQRAMDGDLHAAALIADRLEGKAVARLQVDDGSAAAGFAAILEAVSLERRRRAEALDVELPAVTACLPQVDGLADGLEEAAADERL
jgi:hypothetical protein